MKKKNLKEQQKEEDEEKRKKKKHIRELKILEGRFKNTKKKKTF